jgi:glycosyltransferase involved in cell wall biosynthesis
MPRLKKNSISKNDKLSIFILTKNEEINIEECIKSALFADEVVILDSGSRDNTEKIAKRLGIAFYHADWLGGGVQRNRAIQFCKNNWIFSLDADERITPALAEEINNAIKSNLFDVYDIPRKSLFISRFMRFSGWWPDRTKRLFKKTSGKFSNHFAHSEFLTKKSLGHLNNHMVHFSYRNVDSILKKIQYFSSAGANNYVTQGKEGSLSKAISHGLWAFFKTYFLKFGFLDGREGFILAFMNAETTYYRYIKLMYKRKGI